MSNPAARAGDTVMHDSPHCHAPIHPPAPTPTPLPHPPQPFAIVSGCATVSITGQRAARVGDTTVPCNLFTCVPSGPGTIARGSSSVMIGKMPAARVGDMVSFPSCIGPIPSPTGRIVSPGSATVFIGG